MAMIGTAQVASRLGISPMRVRQLIEAGRLPAQKIGSENRWTYIIDEKDLERVMDRPTGRPPSRKSTGGQAKRRGRRKRGGAA